MAATYADNHQWIEGQKDPSLLILAGSTGPPTTMEYLKSVSSDPETTSKAFNFDHMKLSASEIQGDVRLREQIASFYDQSKVKFTSEDVVLSAGTTSALLLIFYGLVAPGDHVVVGYPGYEGLIDCPRAIGAEMSYWKLDPENNWEGNFEELKSLLRPETKMLVLNNPHNPCGSVLSTSAQEQIVKLAAERNIIIFTDEIFRPLFHSVDVPTSMVEHSSYSRTVVAGSLSKVWGLPGVRAGWVVSRDPKIREAVIKIRKWAVQNISCVDEAIAREVLSPRLRETVMLRTLNNAQANLAVLEKFAQEHKDSFSCVVPKGAATTFAQFKNLKTGQPVDDVEFCTKLKREKAMLLAPGSLCFGVGNKGDWKGFVRIHVTVAPEMFKEGFERLADFLKSGSFLDLPN